jgi:hypothetical protein
VRAEGERDGVTVHEELRSWGNAKTVVISVDYDPKPGETIAIDLAILDAAGIPVLNWNGHASLSIEGDAAVLSYTEDDEVLMSRGEGRAYVHVGRSGEPFVIHATADGLQPGSLAVSPRR